MFRQPICKASLEILLGRPFSLYIVGVGDILIQNLRFGSNIRQDVAAVLYLCARSLPVLPCVRFLYAVGRALQWFNLVDLFLLS